MKTGKNKPMSLEQMNEMNTEIVAGNHLYPDAVTDRADAIRGIVATIGTDVIRDRERVDLRDTESVKAVAQIYLKSCEITGLLPSKSGLARGMGYSRAGIWAFMRSNPEHRTTEFLSIMFDAFSEAVDVAAMGNTIHPIYAIFTQKAQYDLRDNAPIPEPPKRSPLDGVQSQEELARKLAEIIVIDEEEIPREYMTKENNGSAP